MSWIILDLGSDSIKALKAEVEGQRVKILDFAKWKAQPDFYEGLGFPKNEVWVSCAKELNERGWLNGENQIVCSQLPGTYLETRYLRFPFKSDKKIEKVLPIEIESAVPFDVEDILLKSRILRGPGVEEGSEALVLVMAYKRDLIQKYEMELRHFQVSIPSISADILNLASLRGAVPNDPVFGFLNIGHRKTQLLILQNSGLALSARTFFWGGQNLRQKLQAALKVAEDRAQEILVGRASFDVSTESQSVHIEMAEALEESLTLFMNEFRQSMKSYQQQGLTLPKGMPLYLMGKPSQIPGIRTRMEERFKNEFDIRFLPFPYENLSKSVVGLDRLEDVQLALPAVSQVLSQTKNNRPKIQPFSESSFQFQQNIKKLRSESLGILRKVGVVLIAPVIYMVVSFFLQQKEAKHLSSQIDQKLRNAAIELNSNQPSEKIVKELSNMLVQNRNKIEKLQEDKNSPLFILNDLSRVIPANLKIDITEFRVTDNRVSLFGETNSEQTRKDIVQALKTIFDDVKEGNTGPCASTPGCVTLNVEFARPKDAQ